MQRHTDFLQEMGDSLKNAEAPCPTQVVEQQASRQSRRFNIYRNNRAVSLVDNLKSTYPVVYKLVGDEFFSAVARHFIDAHPPRSPVMAEYGSGFGQFLKQAPNTQGIPYIEDVALLEWSRLQAYHAQDAAVLPVDTLVNLAPDDFESTCFGVHPSLHLLSSQWPIGSLWSATMNTTGEVTAAQIDMNQAEHVVIVRPDLEVTMQVLPASGALLLEQLKFGSPLLAAVEHVTQKDPAFDPGSHLQGLIGLGAFHKTYKTGK